MLALRIIERVHRVHSFADLSLHHALSQSNLSGADRALTTELVYGTLRWQGRLDYLLCKVLERDIETLEALVASTLRLGAYQLLFTDRIPDSAAVDQAVRCARAVGAERATGLVNAALRRLAREHREIAFPSLEADPVGHLVHALSLPPWIAKRWLAQFGASEAAALAWASNWPPPLTVRANTTRTDVDTLLAEMRDRFPDAQRCRYAAQGIRLGRKGDPGHDPAFLDGRFTVQDEASQLVVTLLDPQPGETVLDTCAAPGTKTTAIAEQLGDSGSVLALDRNPRRLSLIARAARRLGLSNILVLERDATQLLDDLPYPPEATAGQGRKPQFDRILVDAPCSGLGALRRNPDARWRVQEEDPVQLASIQAALLERAAEVLRPGGVLVYSTCTILSEENEDILRGFADKHDDFRIAGPAELPEALGPLVDSEGFMHCFPHTHDADGFFAARLERSG